ncbi:NAD(P)/FAD-dependent oxidoreductase [Motilibacter aurantiacus]|uniref:NAD(P)/FAD-dependent oxidoreductase n=1 Tax=Motilibacter aurantiacus TaxID=2714955 RepID=UPI00140C1FB6|nr:FAD-dependent oxidoreductase [Motilibacter aurantiacus]NHC44991.1 FAD-dependent oxidoreductase [Motilibacter aurantiacus]
MQSSLRSVVVVGGGLAGLSTCSALRAFGFAEELVLLAAEPHLPYDRPPLSKEVLTGALSPAGVELRPEQWYADNRVDVRLGTRAVALRAGEGAVETGDGRVVRADAVVLATGGVPRPLPVPGGELARVLRTRDDAEELRAALAPGARLLVVGGGLIGAEVASSAMSLGCEVTVADPDPLPLAGAVGAVVAAHLHAQHPAAGVRVLEAGVTALERRGAAVHARLSANPVAEEVEADVVLAGIGIVPDDGLASAAGADVGAGVLVGPDMRSSIPEILAVGDVARPRGSRGPLARREHWEAAVRTGEAAAAALLGTPAPAPVQPWFWTDRYGVHVEVAGLVPPEAAPVLRGDPASGSFAVFFLEAGRLAAAVSVDRGPEARASRRLVDAAAAVEPATLADESVDLRKLARATRG